MTAKEITKSSSKPSNKSLTVPEVKELIDYVITKELEVFQWDGLTIQPRAQYKEVPIDKSIIQSNSAKDVTSLTDEEMLMWQVSKQF